MYISLFCAKHICIANSRGGVGGAAEAHSSMRVWSVPAHYYYCYYGDMFSPYVAFLFALFRH